MFFCCFGTSPTSGIKYLLFFVVSSKSTNTVEPKMKEWSSSRIKFLRGTFSFFVECFFGFVVLKFWFVCHDYKITQNFCFALFLLYIFIFYTIPHWSQPSGTNQFIKQRLWKQNQTTNNSENCALIYIGENSTVMYFDFGKISTYADRGNWKTERRPSRFKHYCITYQTRLLRARVVLARKEKWICSCYFYDVCLRTLHTDQRNLGTSFNRCLSNKPGCRNAWLFWCFLKNFIFVR